MIRGITVLLFGAVLPKFAKDIFKVGPEGLGMMFTAVGAGGVFGGIAAGALMRLDRIGLIQVGAPSEMRGRVVSLIQLNFALIAAGSFLIGPLGDLLGAPGAASLAATVSASLALMLLVTSSRLRQLRLSHYRDA